MLESFSPVLHNFFKASHDSDILSLYSKLTGVKTATSLRPAIGGGNIPTYGGWKGNKSLLTEIRIRKGEPLDRALRRLKKRLARENVIKDARNNRYYEKPSVRKRRKMKVAKFTQMLKTRHADA